MTHPWLAQYPAGVPAEIDASSYASLVALMADSFRRHASLPAYHFMGRAISFEQVDRLSRTLAAWLQSQGLVRGDWLLGMNGVVGNLFVAGLGSFLVAQLAYAQLFWRHRSADGRRRWLAACYLPVAAGLAWLVLPVAGEMAAPVALYMLAITAMVTGAALADRPLLLLAGALAFAFSDATIAINKFVSPVPQAGLVIMLSYYLAQWLLWRGALREPKEISA